MKTDEMKQLGYEYVGKMGDGNELWRWRDELVIYDPIGQEIVWRQTDDISPKKRKEGK